MSRSTTLKERLGLPRLERERAIWFFGTAREDFEQVAAVIEGLAGRDARLAVLLSSSGGGLDDWLRERFPRARVVAVPYDNPLSLRLALPRLKLRAAVFLTAAPQLGARLLSAFAERGLSLVGLTARAADFSALPVERIFQLVAVEETPGEETRPPREAVMPGVCVTRLRAILARDLKGAGSAARKGISGRLLKLTERDPWNRHLAWRLKRLRTLEELSSSLGAPETILCLGNGPSSEDPRLSEQDYDCLFRVNHSWLARGFLAEPDVVFTGAKQSLRAVSRAIFGLQSRGAEMRLVRERSFNPLLPASRFFQVGDITPLLEDFDWGHLRPTNGACMLAVAVALNPKRLVIAGIDLFQHPEGSYPGDQRTANAYSPGHSRDKELAFILHLLVRYRGELVILSDVLLGEWQSYRGAPAAKPPTTPI